MESTGVPLGCRKVVEIDIRSIEFPDLQVEYSTMTLYHR